MIHAYCYHHTLYKWVKQKVNLPVLLLPPSSSYCQAHPPEVKMVNVHTALAIRLLFYFVLLLYKIESYYKKYFSTFFL